MGKATTSITYFTTKVIRQTTVRVKNGKVGTTDVADAELLMTGGTRGIGELLQFPLKKRP